MFGYPTGIGALLVRRDRAALLKDGHRVGIPVRAHKQGIIMSNPIGDKVDVLLTNGKTCRINENRIDETKLPPWGQRFRRSLRQRMRTHSIA